MDYVTGLMDTFTLKTGVSYHPVPTSLYLSGVSLFYGIQTVTLLRLKILVFTENVHGPMFTNVVVLIIVQSVLIIL